MNTRAVIQIGTILVLIHAYSSAWQHQCNLYQTHLINNDYSHDCLYYMISSESDADGKKNKSEQILEYCIRLAPADNYQAVEGAISSKLTFDQLKQENVTVDYLRKWSSSIDLMERYQEFININNSFSSEEFYNCTIPWFGSLCQYKFPLSTTFPDIVSRIFKSKVTYAANKTKTCYEHIQCDRGSPLLCLDWREICDGKIDCINGDEDEKHCIDLHLNQCDENEYQCRNGMCIDKAFLFESGSTLGLGYECLDRSDESARFNSISLCYNNPSFQCEEAACLFPGEFTCGDGMCARLSLPKALGNLCHNNRDQVFNYFFVWHNETVSYYSRCFKIAICASNIIHKTDFDFYCKKLCTDVKVCQKNLEFCPSYVFAPVVPVWDGHIRLGYFLNQTIISQDLYLIPHFVCFDYYKCPFSFPTFKIDNYVCLLTQQLNYSSPRNFFEIFFSCIYTYRSIDENKCSLTSMIRCLGNNKCIPKRHIMDGIPDCYESFDESIEAKSCFLNDTNRFQCISENKCLQPTLVGDGISHCIGGEDELSNDVYFIHIDQIPFSALCDRRQDFKSSTNETDETNCEQWPCVNQYTRCNKVWNCPKGVDEINCPSPFKCPSDHHPCAFPNTENMGCLHYNRSDDGIVDCLGATDEREHCKLSYPNQDTLRYRCWNDTKCVTSSYRCDRCNKVHDVDELCEKCGSDCREIEYYFERMFDSFHAVKLPFSPKSSREIGVKILFEPTDKFEQNQTYPNKTSQNVGTLDRRQAWLCNRGILIHYGKNQSEKCLCPPAYYGNHCQYQNQRVSLTLRFHSKSFDKFAIIGAVIILVDNTGLIHSYEQLTYIPIDACNTKFNVYLLYRDRPKNITKNYTIHIDTYNKINLRHLASWSLPVKFLFMPINRMSAQLIIPDSSNCHTSCDSANNEQKTNTYDEPCVCQSKTPRRIVIDQMKCDCSIDSLCVGIVNNRSICLCPLTKSSPRCLLDSSCQSNRCMNKGLCVPNDDRVSSTNFTCVCQDGFFGLRCENKEDQIDISFLDVSIPQAILVHFITVRKYYSNDLSPMPVRATMFKKIKFDEDNITFFTSYPFHLVFAQIEQKYYLTVLQHNYTPSVIIQTEISESQYCPHVGDFFNKSIIDYPILRRVKYYHLLCIQYRRLACFHDNETFMCLCSEERNANCFHFNFNMNYNCAGTSICQNDARCFQDHPTCPTKIMCVCRDCFYGNLCQFTTQQFGLSLDAILGYHIRPHISINRQSVYIKISIIVAFIMLAIGLLSGFLSILTFQSPACRKVGCGTYILTSSITSILIAIALNLKLWFLILSQMSIITSRSFLLFNCISTEFFLRFLLAITDWFHACVAVERLFTVILDVKFNLQKSKSIAKLSIFIVPFIVLVSLVHDPIHRRLVSDEEEQRTWCLIRLKQSTERYNSFINIFHFITPFSLKLISTITIIFFIAKKRSTVKKQNTYRQNIKEQFHRHKNLIISSSFLVILALPRLVLAFASGCMKSAREPSVFLGAYFVSFIPSLLTFVIFVPTSKTYKEEFKKVMRKKLQTLRLVLNRY